ncbi:MAG TPA: Do family serine endopeptidase [Spirochaetia bacterium]|nr:Do family serine endopeptidase [Spirochaetia bacterium]
MKINRKQTALIAVPAAVAAALVLFFAPVLGFTQVRSAVSPRSAAQTSDPPQLAAEAGNLASLQTSFREVSKKVLPVVVEINVTQVVTQKVPQLDLPFDLPFPFFDQQPNGNGNGGGERKFRQSGLGSGIIVQRSGDRYYVLTNNHVVKDANDISVRLSDQKVFKARVVGADPRKDIALVSFTSGDSLPVAELGDSNTVQVGDIVLAVGNPLGFESTVTMGIVSALGRRGPQGDVAAYTDYIQTDAAINQGNSGGALVNIKGQVIGINTWIAAPSGGNVGLGFAVPINNASSAIGQFIAKGHVDYGWLGAQIADIQDKATYPGFASDLKVEGVKGALMLNLYKGSPADRAGLLPGDYITAVAGAPVRNADELTQAVGRLEAGREYTFSIIRYGQMMRLPVRVGVRDDKDQVAQDKNLWPGMTVVDITDDVRSEASIPRSLHGVAVGYLPQADTPSSIAGFRPGDVITAINGKPVRNMMDYYRALNEKQGSQVTFHLVRDGTEISVGLSR